LTRIQYGKRTFGIAKKAGQIKPTKRWVLSGIDYMTLKLKTHNLTIELTPRHILKPKKQGNRYLLNDSQLQQIWIERSKEKTNIYRMT
jgi:hypothetical protein